MSAARSSVVARVFGSSSDEDTEPPRGSRSETRRCGKAPRHARLIIKALEARVAALEAQLALERAMRTDAEAAPPQRMQCPLTLRNVARLACPVSVGHHIVSGPAFAKAVAHDNPRWAPDDRAAIRVRHFHSRAEYATLGFAVTVVTEAQQRMYGCRPTPLGATDQSAADLIVRLMGTPPSRARGADFRASDSSDSDFD